MQELNDTITKFLEKQGFVMVSTLDEDGMIHCSAKGIVGIEKEGKVHIIDLYKAHTFSNLKNKPVISLTAINERKFQGYTLKGTAEITEREKMGSHLIKKWEERVIQRISKRVVKSVQKYKGSNSHPESHFPPPKYLISVTVERIVDLAPKHLKKQA